MRLAHDRYLMNAGSHHVCAGFSEWVRLSQLFLGDFRGCEFLEARLFQGTTSKEGKRYMGAGRWEKRLLLGQVGGGHEDREHTGANRLTKARGHIR